MKLTTNQAAEILGISQRRVIALIEQEKLPAEKFANVYMIDEKDLDLVKERKVGRPSKMVSSIQLKFSNLSDKDVITTEKIDEVIKTVFHGKSEKLIKTKGSFVLKYNFDKPLPREEVLQKRNDLFSRLYFDLSVDTQAHLLMFIEE